MKVCFCCSTHTKVIDIQLLKRADRILCFPSEDSFTGFNSSKSFTKTLFTVCSSVEQMEIFTEKDKYICTNVSYSPDKLRLYSLYKMFTYLSLISCLRFLVVLQCSLFPQRLSEVLHSKLLISADTLCPTCCSCRRLFCFAYLYYMLTIIISSSSLWFPTFCSPNDWELLQANSFSCKWYCILFIGYQTLYDGFYNSISQKYT